MQSIPPTTERSQGPPNDYGEAIARGLEEASTHRDRTLSSVERFVKWAYGFGSIIVFIAVWVARIQWDMAQIKETVALNKAEIKAQHEQHEADRLSKEIQKALTDALQAQINLVNKELDLRSQDINHTREMWFMKEHGISNKEDFERKNGYPAPK